MKELNTPGRICLFGDKIDLAGYPVIAAAINLKLNIKIEKIKEKKAIFQSQNLNKEETFNEKEYKIKDTPFSYLNAVRQLLNDKVGYKININSEIPIGGGMSSSAAITVGFIKALKEEYNLNLKDNEIAELAYKAEHDICKIMCGRMDQYSIANGGVTYIETGDTPKVEKIKIKELPIIVADSQEHRQAGIVLKVIKEEYNKGNPIVVNGFQKINNAIPTFKEALTKNDYKKIGELMNMQQEIERSYNQLGIKCETEKISLLCNEAIKAGALGAKQMGAGGGGCMIAICPNKQEEVAKAIEKAGGKVYKIKIFDY